MTAPEKHLTQARQRAADLDAQDTLAAFRARFSIADDELLYLDGNSLGRMPKATRDLVDQVVDQEWSQNLIRSWGESWYQAPQRIGDKLARIIGAEDGQVLISDSTTVNLFKLIVSALSLKPGRKQVISDELNFPTDLYTLQSALDLLGSGHSLTLLPSPDTQTISLESYEEALSEEVALVTFSTPTFKSGFLHDIPEMTRMAHEAGALVLWDFSHAVGSIPLQVDTWSVDFAVGCTYKYLNGGPGAPAFLYVNRKHHEAAMSKPWGWWGHAAPFKFDLDYQPADSIRRHLVGTPPVLSMLAIEPALAIVEEAGMESIRAKGLQLGEFFVELYDQLLSAIGYELGSPRDPQRRGSHISIRHPEGYRIYQALVATQNLLPDFREPDNIRLGFAPLYTRFSDIVEAVRRLHLVVVEKRYEAFDEARATVT